MTEYTGRTVAEAIEKGLQDLNLTRDEVEIEIIEEGRGGVFGLGSKEAQVRIRPRSHNPDSSPNPDAPEVAEEVGRVSEDFIDAPAELQGEVAQATAETEEDVTVGVEELASVDAERSEEEEILAICQQFLQSTLALMGLKTEVETSYEAGDSGEPTYLLNIEGEDLGILIGRRGETLEAIQYLVRLVVNRHTRSWPRIEVDVERYKQRRTTSLQRLAVSMADRAVREERTVVLEAMPARERRLIHLALRDRDDVYTESIGEGENRKVTIVPN